MAILKFQNTKRMTVTNTTIETERLKNDTQYKNGGNMSEEESILKLTNN